MALIGIYYNFFYCLILIFKSFFISIINLTIFTIKCLMVAGFSGIVFIFPILLIPVLFGFMYNKINNDFTEINNNFNFTLI